MALTFSAVLLGSQEAFAGASPFDHNFVHATWDSPDSTPSPPVPFMFDPNSPFSLSDAGPPSGYVDISICPYVSTQDVRLYQR